MSLSEWRAGYEYESEDDVIIPELLNKEQWINSPSQQFTKIVEPEPEEETEPRERNDLYKLKWPNHRLPKGVKWEKSKGEVKLFKPKNSSFNFNIPSSNIKKIQSPKAWIHSKQRIKLKNGRIVSGFNNQASVKLKK